MCSQPQSAGPVKHALGLGLKPARGVVDICELGGAGQEFVSRTAWSRDDEAIGGLSDGAHAPLVEVKIRIELGCPDPSTPA